MYWDEEDISNNDIETSYLTKRVSCSRILLPI